MQNYLDGNPIVSQCLRLMAKRGNFNGGFGLNLTIGIRRLR